MKHKKTNNASPGRQGLFFSIDALIAAMLLIGGLIAASQYHVTSQSTTNLNYISEDLMSLLGEIKVSELNNTYVKSLIESEVITHLNNTLLEQIGEFWSLGNKELATNMTEQILFGFSQIYGYGLFIDGIDIWQNNITNTRTLVSSFKLISGLAENRSSNGFVARATALGLSGNSTDVFVFNPEGSGFGAGAAKKATIIKRVYLNYSGLTSSNLFLSIHTGTSGVGNQNKIYVNGNDITSSFIWTYEDQPGLDSNTRVSFGNLSVTQYLVNGWNNITLELFGQNQLHTHLHPGGRLEVTYVKNKEYVPYSNVMKRQYLDEIKGWGGAWAIVPIEVPQDAILREVTFNLKATNIDNKPPGQIPVSNKYNVQIYLNDQTIALTNPDGNGVVQGSYNLTSKLHEGTNVLSVYLNAYGDVNWGESNEKIIHSTPEYSMAYLKNKNLMEPEMSRLGASIYRKSSNSETSTFLDTLSKFALVVIEDASLTTSQINDVEKFVEDGGIAFMSGRTVPAGTRFGMTFTDITGGKNSSIRNYNPLLDISEGTILEFSENPKKVSGQITIIANTSNNATISNWTYGDGKVYYFSDFNETTLGDLFQEKVAGAIEMLVPASNSTYVEVRYDDTNRRRLQWGKLAISKSENIGGNKSISKLFIKNMSEDYIFLSSYIALATLDFNKTVVKLNGVQEFYTPRPYATPTDIFMDPEHYLDSNNTFNLTEGCSVCQILPETTFHYTILVPAAVGYGGTFSTLALAKEDARQRLIDLLGEFATYTSIQENNSMILSNIPAMWGPALVELRVWN